MKQLLQCHGKWAIAALNDRAFLFQLDSERTTELLPASSDDKISNDENPIQAVALAEESGMLWCAVTTMDKCLWLYCVDPNEATSKQEPKTTHTTIKRVGAVSFGRVPTAPVKDESDRLSEKGALVCCTAGLTGDAWAWSLEKSGKKRLLLGHTASMLTGIKVKGNAILTSDRDEKIRVTAFPDTSIIRGFLFGHEAYISGMDAATSPEKSICASCSGGDGTVRLWNYETTQLLDTLKPTKNTDINSSTPSRVCIDAEANTIGVIYDQSNDLDIFSIEKDSDGKEKSLKPVQSINCSSQPLSITFVEGGIVVLQTEPTYIQTYRPNSSQTWEPVDLVSCSAIQNLATESKITMPDSVLEKDQHGQTTMSKQSETRGGAARPIEEMPWNRSERVDIAKERSKRHKRRRKQKQGD